MPKTAAQLRAAAKYDKKTYNTFSVKMKKEETAALDEYIKENGIKSRNNYITNCINYCMGKGYTFPDNGADNTATADTNTKTE